MGLEVPRNINHSYKMHIIFMTSSSETCWDNVSLCIPKTSKHKYNCFYCAVTLLMEKPYWGDGTTDVNGLLHISFKLPGSARSYWKSSTARCTGKEHGQRRPSGFLKALKNSVPANMEVKTLQPTHGTTKLELIVCFHLFHVFVLVFISVFGSVFEIVQCIYSNK